MSDRRLGKLHNVQNNRTDFDPEDDPYVQAESGSEADSNREAELAGREHYETVGESKLRKPDEVKLDANKYGGQVVSRSAMNGQDEDDFDMFAPAEEDEDEDPFAKRNDKQDKDSEGEDEGEALGVDASAGAHVDTPDDDEKIQAGMEDIENGEDDEIASDEAFEEGDEARFRDKGFVFRGSGKNKSIDETAEIPSEDNDSIGDEDVDMDDMSDDEDDEEADDLDSAGTDVESVDGTDATDMDDEDEDEIIARPDPKSIPLRPQTEREKLKALISTDTAAIAASLSQAALSDVQKGKAVKQQYQMFDRLLDARIKLQKGLIAANDLHPVPSPSLFSDIEAQSALRKAQEAALNLYSTIESLRLNILDSNAQSETSNPSKKRKRPSAATSSTSTHDLWSRLQNLESQSLPQRRTTIDKWSTRTRTTTTTTTSSSSSSKILDNESQTQLTRVLDTYLHSEHDKLFAQSTMPLSADTNPQTDEHVLVFNDTQYYQSLLRDLIASRARLSHPTSSAASASVLDTPLPMKLHPSGNVSNQQKGKKVDTKASKGRKIRYAVHEKLENFMAGTGEKKWTDAAVREFFGSLMGQSTLLNERGDDSGDDGVDEDRNEVEALRLFRS